MSAEGIDSRPAPPSWLNADLIQTALRNGENDSTITVLSCDFTMANAVGDGYMSNMYRAVAILEGGDERRLVIKCQLEGGIPQQMAEETAVFERETKVLAETLPKMHKILKDKGMNQELGAKCYYHGREPVPFIVLEDLRWSGFTLADRMQGLDIDHCKLVLKAQALFHASSLALNEQDPSALDYYKNCIFNEDFRKHFAPFTENSFDAVAKIVLEWPGYERFTEKLKSARSNCYDRIMETAKYKEGKLNTLLHADTWTNNIMFKYNDGKVEDVRLVDFQGSYYASPTIDLQTFLITCPNEEVRNNMDLVFKEYHTTLVNTMTKLNCMSKIITLEELKQDFDEHSVFGLFSSVSTLPLVMSEEMKKMKLEDLFQTNDTTLRAIKEISKGGVYERVTKQLLLKYESLGIL